MSDQSRLRKPFLAAGALTGLLGSGWYLLRTLRAPVPDPVWTRFVNVTLILFAAIYSANLIRRVVEMVLNKGGGEGRK
jgi:hypothetical protein